MLKREYFRFDGAETGIHQMGCWNRKIKIYSDKTGGYLLDDKGKKDLVPRLCIIDLFVR